MSRVSPSFAFRGHELPSFLYGTAWKEEATESCVLAALAAGFRGIDTANQRKHYHEAGVGAALKKVFAEGSLRREDLFIQSKFTYAAGQDHRLPYDHDADPETQVRQSFASTLRHLGVDRVDSYVLHGPSRPEGLGPVDFETWRAMECLHHEHECLFLGVSNVNLDQLRALVEAAEILPAFVQNRCYARNAWDREIRAFCRDHDMIYQGFSLLTANRRELAAAAVTDMVRRSGRSLPQLVFRFAMQMGMLPLTGTTDPTHMAHDLEVFDFELDRADLKALEECGVIE